jgi:hypothetical protein
MDVGRCRGESFSMHIENFRSHRGNQGKANSRNLSQPQAYETAKVVSRSQQYIVMVKHSFVNGAGNPHIAGLGLPVRTSELIAGADKQR